PAHGETLAVTMGRILRFPYSEWTVWSLPLIAHEFGHVVIGDLKGRDDNKDLRELIPNAQSLLKQKDPEQDVFKVDAQASEEIRKAARDQAAKRAEQKTDEYLADAFGTYYMGPAYACAAIHLRLNPAYRSVLESGLDHERAYVVLAMLQMMSQATPKVAREYQDILEDYLRPTWSKMVSGA